MPYPNQIDSFVEKLNKNDAGYVIEDEILELNNGVYEGELAHDNVKNESVMIFTSPQMAGERIFNFFLSIPAEAPWKRSIKVFSDAPMVYVTYETLGDQVEAEDINRVQDSIVNTQTEVERYKVVNDQIVVKKVDNSRVLTDVPLNAKFTDTIYTHPSSHPASMITESTAKRFVSDTEKGAWNDADSKKHTHDNKSILDAITQALIDAWNSAVNHISDAVKHITAAERTAWNSKQDALSGDVTSHYHSADRAWANITGKPATYVPSSHNHDTLYLNRTNTGVFTPTANYHPATKKYVDDKVAGTGTGDMLKSVYDIDNDGIVDKAKTVVGPVTWNQLKGVL